MIRRFNRYELKYVLRAEDKAAIARDLKARMQPDAHGQDGAYTVSSLYFDSPDRACFRAKEEGIRYRRKVRARIYGRYLEDPTGPTHLEIKQRIGKTVQKRRVVAPLEDALDWIDRGRVPTLPDAVDAEVANEVAYLARTLQLEPAAVTSYVREAWVGAPSESGLRVTFDGAFICRSPERALAPGAEEHLVMPRDLFIMEIKVNEAVPLWVTRVVARHACVLRRVSKYCESVRTLSGRPAGMRWAELHRRLEKES